MFHHFVDAHGLSLVLPSGSRRSTVPVTPYHHIATSPLTICAIVQWSSIDGFPWETSYPASDSEEYSSLFVLRNTILNTKTFHLLTYVVTVECIPSRADINRCKESHIRIVYSTKVFFLNWTEVSESYRNTWHGYDLTTLIKFWLNHGWITTYNYCFPLLTCLEGLLHGSK